MIVFGRIEQITSFRTIGRSPYDRADQRKTGLFTFTL